MNYEGGPNRIVAALLELVELKDMKDGFGVEPFGEHNGAAAVAEYEFRKPLAWNEARGALTEFFAASAILPLDITQGMVDAVNSRDGWGGFTAKDLRVIVEAIRTAANRSEGEGK